MQRIRPDSRPFTLLLGALVALPALSIDMGLPALPAIAEGIGTTNWSAALTISLFQLGFAPSQLVVGTLSDRYGRRPVLLAGLALYAACSAGAAMSHSIGLLLFWRVAEGAGAAAGPVIAFAIVRDSFAGAAARGKLSYVTMVFAVAPIVAPTLGGLLLGAGGWRSIYALLGATGAALALVVALGLPETHRPGRRHPLLAGFGRVLRDRHCMGYALVNALAFSGMFSFIAASSLVFMGDLGVSVAAFGALFAFAALGLVLGSSINGWLAGRGVAARVPLWGGLVAAFGAALVPFVLQVTVGLGPYGLIVFMVFTTSSRGLVNPNAVAGAMEGLPEVAGAVAATLGCLQSLGMALSSTLVALLHPAFGPPAMTGVMSACGLASLAAMAMVARQRGPALLRNKEARIQPPTSPPRRQP